MNFFKRLGMVLYMLLMLGAGGLFLVISLNMFPPEQWAEMLNVMSGAVACRIAIGAAGGLFVIIGIAAPYRLEKKLKKSRIVAFQNPDGEVTVSLSAIEDYIRKTAKDIPGIKDVRSRVDINRRGIDIRTDVAISSGANIPEVTERIQTEVKNRVHGMLGVEKQINMKMHIKKISTRGAGPGKGAVREDSPDMMEVPYREI